MPAGESIVRKTGGLMLLLTVVMMGCSTSTHETKAKDLFVYYAIGSSWAATYTILDGGETYFDSLYIQNLDPAVSGMKPIEYVLKGDGREASSQYPQPLQGVRSFQVSTEYNKQLIDLSDYEDKVYQLTIRQDGKEEHLTLTYSGAQGGK